MEIRIPTNALRNRDHEGWYKTGVTEGAWTGGVDTAQ